ncbi:arginine deiminase family protein [Mastigocoleus testarum]|uniref:Arginine deiminase n=1 Tax=Mastigocoleus testarum BC008 TaxID=371196 RepID=A0A0V7ZYG6_9CYAN|nr:arginine deiminase family protein [Mastigocoleus testarum]KST65205.1 hypothetical protein BC008_20645 [Mastigocoleus testarum BC008]KST69620.1 hypothetical protein BC008_04770 [Mastigocoleus testarum BC008]
MIITRRNFSQTSRFSRHALVVEDNAAFWESRFPKLLPDADWVITFATTIEEAKQKFWDDCNFDLIISGYQIGSKSGREFLTFARQIDQNIPIFLLFDPASSKNFDFGDTETYRALALINKSNCLTNPDKVRAKIKAEYEQYMVEMCTPHIQSEYGQLQTVLVHTPSDEIDRIEPNDPWYLIDSRPALHLAQQQHREFIRVIKENSLRPIVLDIALLLYDVIKSLQGDQLRQVVENILFDREFQSLKHRFGNHNLELSPLLKEKVDEICSSDLKQITSQLMCGLNIADLLAKDAGHPMFKQRDSQIVPPVPNLYFMRDPGFALGESLVLSRMYWEVRRREPSIIRTVINYHPFMKNAKSQAIDWNLDSGEQFFIEGGDVMVIAPNNFAIALSERTSRQAVRKVAQELIGRGAERVFQPMIPAKRAFIHLDTVCSVVGPNHMVVHPEAVSAYGDTLCWSDRTFRSGGEPESLQKDFITVLRSQFGKNIIEVTDPCEQFDDAVNVFMIKADTAVAYDRNPKANQALRENGIRVMEFSGSDLVVGRGGARCMTMPIRRN